jgi:ribosome-associated protein
VTPAERRGGPARLESPPVPPGADDPPAPSAVVRITRQLAIPVDELRWRFSTSGGPGGQHANRSNTRVEVRFDVANSPSLGPRQRSRLLDRIGPEVRASSSEERSQARNRDRALARLADRLRAGLRVDPVRVPTAPSKAARQRRLDDKKRRSARKRERADRPAPDA